MKVRMVLVWTLVNEKMHPGLRGKERTIEGTIPVLEALFPGINYYSVSGYNDVMNECGRPALKKLFPQPLGTTAEQIADDAMADIPKILPSKGYEWQRRRWGRELKKLLKAD